LEIGGADPGGQGQARQDQGYDESDRDDPIGEVRRPGHQNWKYRNGLKSPATRKETAAGNTTATTAKRRTRMAGTETRSRRTPVTQSRGSSTEAQPIASAMLASGSSDRAIVTGRSSPGRRSAPM